MDCCVLHTSEVGRLHNYNIPPNHADHTHINTKVAIQGLVDGVYELIEDRNGRTYVTPAKTYFLQRKRSGYIDTIQRVLSNHIEQLKPVR
jgi:hypothetical protein